MFLQRWLRPGPARNAGARLYAATVAQAREPAIYAELGAPDTPDGRFEVYTLHVLLVLARLQGEGGPAAGEQFDPRIDETLPEHTGAHHAGCSEQNCLHVGLILKRSAMYRFTASASSRTPETPMYPSGRTR